ncbi:hypothetical protein RAE21_17525 [Rhodoferax sp. TBRC 17198]|jgi:hypothetical protein|nr:hypothetical protein [Rhodoferax sp. TBRC 17198]MDT7524186.1 hypothetical protein [Rhodoferax sp. TBRC 17198]
MNALGRTLQPTRYLEDVPVMFHVLRNEDGSIASLARTERPGGELLPDDHPAIQAFLKGSGNVSSFSEADAEFVRVLEDLIDTLIVKNIIRHTDLPVAAQQKITRRKGLRNRMQGALNLLDDDQRII